MRLVGIGAERCRTATSSHEGVPRISRAKSNASTASITATSCPPLHRLASSWYVFLIGRCSWERPVSACWLPQPRVVVFRKGMTSLVTTRRLGRRPARGDSPLTDLSRAGR